MLDLTCWSTHFRFCPLLSCYFNDIWSTVTKDEVYTIFLWMRYLILSNDCFTCIFKLSNKNGKQWFDWIIQCSFVDVFVYGVCAFFIFYWTNFVCSRSVSVSIRVVFLLSLLVLLFFIYYSMFESELFLVL